MTGFKGLLNEFKNIKEAVDVDFSPEIVYITYLIGKMHKAGKDTNLTWLLSRMDEDTFITLGDFMLSDTANFTKLSPGTPLENEVDILKAFDKVSDEEIDALIR